MDCKHNYNDKLDTLNPSLKERLCSLCLKAEVEKLKAENDTFTSCIVKSNTIIADLREALERLAGHVGRMGRDIIDEVLKDSPSEPEPERWGCCGTERNEIHGDYCPRCS